MTQEDLYSDKYEHFEASYDPAWQDPRQPHRKQKTQESQRTHQQIIAGLTDDLNDVDLGLKTTYRPSRYEQGWLLSSLYTFFDEGLITDVLTQIKGGKEASVYCCRAHPATGVDLLAAKVYRPRMFRNLRNDKMYRQGREILVGDGRYAGRDSGHIRRAIRNKSTFGLQSAHTSWLMHEFTTLRRLYEAGAAVPRPIAPSDNAILMSYLGDEQMAAPTLNSVRLGVEEAESLFQEMLRNVDIMLQHDLVHGDLSAYNILYWAPGDEWGEMTLIDFPQVINLHTNKKARFILKRDITRACEYFGQQGVHCNPRALFDEFWQRYMDEPDPEDVAADTSRLEQEMAALSEEEEYSLVD